MRRGGRPALVLAAAALVPAGVAGCGGGSSPNDGSGAARVAAHGYATQVASITQRTAVKLAAISKASSYESAPAAAASTRDYAATIRAAAQELRAAKPPASIAKQHGALVRLYATTADRMDQLAGRFGAAKSVEELATRAQELSAEIQRYSSQEEQVRSAIQRTLAETTTAPAPSTTPTGNGAPASTPASTPAPD